MTAEEKQIEPSNFVEYCERHGERGAQRLIDIRNELVELLDEWAEAEKPDELDAAVRAISVKKANRIITNGLRDLEEWYIETLPELLAFLCRDEGLQMPEYKPEVPREWLRDALRDPIRDLVSQVADVHDAAAQIAAIVRQNSGASWVSEAFENFCAGWANPIEGVRRTVKAFSGNTPEQKEAVKADTQLQNALQEFDDESELFYDAAFETFYQQIETDTATFAALFNEEALNALNKNEGAESSSNSLESRLAKLNSLLEKGLISQNDFEAKKEQILSEL